MNKIKSERAKAHIKNHTFDCENVDTIERHLCPSDARQAIKIAEKDAEERHAKELKEVEKKAFNQGCWTCVQNVSSIVNRNDVGNVCTDLIRSLGISEDEAQILSSVDDFRREEIYDAMGWSYYWINNGGQSDE